MKTKLLFSILFLSIISVSCKQEEKKDDVQQVEVAPKVNPNSFKVIFEVIAKKDDRFHLYYTEDGSINFPEDKSIWVDVRGSNVSQAVTFNLPDDVIPSQLRIDFGTNRDQGEMKINNFKMTYFGKVFEAKDKFFFDYFGPNLTTVKVDKEKAMIYPIVEEGKDYTPPSFYPSQESLGAQIKLLTQEGK